MVTFSGNCFIRIVGQVLRDCVGKAQFALLRQLRDRNAGERFVYRTEVESSGGVIWRFGFLVREAHGPFKDGFAVFRYEDCPERNRPPQPCRPETQPVKPPRNQQVFWLGSLAHVARRS